ncbi:DUF7714 family protein [Pseudonocardia acidicola]|uniref:Uncharacterized protein n=1 Tax=Pseudonocardia acidicola TaxID=2724939 RepID=A0ABX1SKF0_9PSEU|nr:hypothetical protein [Pseudonocardia acidicola]NMI01328.1 hypothetical protein [Pseudonocardia acidicola]
MTSVHVGPNFIPNRYRGVSVTTVPAGVPLDEPSLREHLMGRDAYRRTRFVVARYSTEPGPVALLHVTRASDVELFSPVVGVELLAGPDECAYVVDPEADTGIPSVLAAVAREKAPGVQAVVVQGRYAHVNFIINPRPLRIVVREVVPPEPAKLLDQARRVIAVTESLPPIELAGELTELSDLAARQPDEHYLLPCRGSGGEVPGATVSYLDEHPDRAEWTLLGCARSQQIHRWFYGDDPPTVDFCPKRALREAGDVTPGGGFTLTKCCLQEEHVESGDGWVSVPWGSSLDHIREALALLVAQEDPVWEPV